uniref:Uncharacterized protein n=2 Tax=Solanum TaxID=4107 RepID=M1DI36_SOLTU
MTTQANRKANSPMNPNVGKVATRIRDFTRMNPHEFHGSKVYEGPQEFSDEIYKIVADHLASLVGIIDQLGDSPFGVVHRRIAPAFNIVVLWVIGRHGTTSRNFSSMRRLLPVFADLILSFRAQHTGTKGEVRPFGDSAGGLGDPQAFIFFVLFSLFVPFCDVVSMLSFKLQIPET